MKRELNYIATILLILVFGFSNPIIAQPDTLYISSWNLQNLFDTDDHPDKRDEDFTPEGNYKWDKERLDFKLEQLAKVIKDMNDGKGPDLLGVQEVENQLVLDSLINVHFKERNYKVAYKESPDNRGIDNGIIYDADKFKLLDVLGHEVILPDKYPTRLILHGVFEYKGVNLNVYVNHWPSRRGGEEKSAPNRAAAAKKLKRMITDLFAFDKTANIVILGDFNDEPNNKSIEVILGAEEFRCEMDLDVLGLYNLSYNLFDEGRGSYLFRGDFNMLDQIILSKSAIDEGGFSYICNSFEIFAPSYSVQKDGRYKGSMLPTYGGRTYLSGFSDHFPVSVKLAFEGDD